MCPNAKDELTASELKLEGVEVSFGSYDTRHLEKGASYVVYAVTPGSPNWYFIADERYTYYPFAYPALLFETVDPSESRYWVNNASTRSGERMFKEWASDPFFYESVLMDVKKAVSVFRRVKAAMDVEFMRPDVQMITTRFDEQWGMCPHCDEAWEAAPGALTVCPGCGKTYKNAAKRD